MTGPQVAELLGISYSQLRYMERTGNAPTRIYIGPRMKRYRRNDVEAWLSAREYSGATAAR